MRSTWRMIVVTVFMSVLALGVTSMTLRARAQDSPPPAAPAPAAAEPKAGDAPVDEAGEDETVRRARDATLSDEEAPEFRDSADNNLSFPIDI